MDQGGRSLFAIVRHFPCGPDPSSSIHHLAVVTQSSLELFAIILTEDRFDGFLCVGGFRDSRGHDEMEMVVEVCTGARIRLKDMGGKDDRVVSSHSRFHLSSWEVLGWRFPIKDHNILSRVVV